MNPSPPDSEDELFEILNPYCGQLVKTAYEQPYENLKKSKEMWEEAKAAIRSWALSQALGAKPDMQPIPNNPLDLPSGEFDRKAAYNTGLDVYEQSLKEVFKEPE